jgi:hypothetical protein
MEASGDLPVRLSGRSTKRMATDLLKSVGQTGPSKASMADMRLSETRAGQSLESAMNLG